MNSQFDTFKCKFQNKKCVNRNVKKSKAGYKPVMIDRLKNNTTQHRSPKIFSSNYI